MSSIARTVCCDRVSNFCDSVSTYVVGSGILTSSTTALVSSLYYASYPLTAVSLFSFCSCTIGLIYLRKYRNLKPLDQAAEDVNEDAQTVVKTAQELDELAKNRLGAGGALVELNQEMQEELNTTRAQDQQRADENKQLKTNIHDLTSQISIIQDEKALLEQQIEKLKVSIPSLTEKIRQLKDASIKISDSNQQVRITIGTLEEDEKEIGRASADLDVQVKQLEQEIQEAKEELLALRQEKEKMRQLDPQQLHSLVDRFDAALHSSQEEQVKDAERQKRIEEFLRRKK